MLLGSKVRFPLLFETLTTCTATEPVEGAGWPEEADMDAEEAAKVTATATAEGVSGEEDEVTAATSTEDVTAVAAIAETLSVVALP